MVSSTDHVSPVTGITPAVTISKNGGAFVSPSGAISEIGSGWYQISGNSTDRNTYGDFLVHATGTGADPVDDRYMIVGYDPFDPVRMGISSLPNAAADAAGGLPVSDTGGLDLDSKLANTHEITAARMSALTDWLDGGRLDLLLDALIARLTETRAGYIDLLANATYGLSALRTLLLAGVPCSDKTGFALTTAEHTAIANEVEAQIINDTDSEKVLQAITDKIAAVNPSLSGLTLAAIASAIRTELATELARIDTNINSRLASAGYTSPPSVVDIQLGLAKTSEITSAVSSIKGADGDTLKTLSDQIDNINIAAGGGLAGSNSVTITVQDEDGNNVVEASVNIYDSAGTTFYERKTTNSSGQTQHSMDDGTYTVKIHKAGYSFNSQTLEVNGSETPIYTGEAFNIPVSSDPNLCTVFINLSSLDGAKPATATGTARVVSLPYEKEGWYISHVVNGVYNSVTGVMTFPLIRGAEVVINVDGFGINDRFTVPDVTEADFKSIVGKVKL